MKLDIDTPNVELAIINTILSDPKYYNLIDQFYFEHHVAVRDMYPRWGRESYNESISTSMHMFHTLRSKGIAAHYWP